MTIEYIYKNKKEEYSIDWDKLEFTVQANNRDFNLHNADYAIDYEIYCDYYDQQIGYLHFSVYGNVNAKDVHPSLPDKKFETLIYINNILVQQEYRGWGIGEHIYDKFGEIYEEQFMGVPVAQVFVNPIAEYIYRKEVQKGNIPKEALTEELIVREYNEEEKKKAEDLFEWLPNSVQKDFKEKVKEMNEKNQLTSLNNLEKYRNKLLKKNSFKTSKTRLRKVAIDNIDEFLAKIQIEYSGQPGDSYHKIQALLNGNEIGYIEFSEKGDKVLSLDRGYVEPDYANTEIEEMLLDKFGMIYEGDYSGYKVILNFHEPEFERAYRSLVSQGLIPQTALDNELVNRNYDEEQQIRWNDYKETLPEHVRGASRLKRKMVKQ